MPNATPDPEDWIGPDEYLGQQVWQHRYGTFADGCKYAVLYDNGEEALFRDLNEAYRAVRLYAEGNENPSENVNKLTNLTGRPATMPNREREQTFTPGPWKAESPAFGGDAEANGV